jgi:ribonucleoside-diphosphate reductase alpha chain
MATARAKRKTKRRAGPAAEAGTPVFERFFSREGEDPFEAVGWERRTARIEDADGRVVFEQQGVEVPDSWSRLATDLVASRYFAGAPGTRARETSVRQVVSRVSRTIARWAREDRWLGSPREERAFRDEVARLLLSQRAAFNSPVFFNVGVDPEPQASACFILGLDDRLDAILDQARVEGRVFSKGGGTGTNFSRLRGSTEATTAGGHASGPVAFMRGLDALAGSIKSGGRTRRAAKMAILDADHPDVLLFVRSKAEEEARARALEAAGLVHGGDVAADAAVGYQNENHSVRVSDAFLRAAERDGEWALRRRKDGKVDRRLPARELLREMAAAAHACGDPGLHLADTIESWNPVPRTGPIRASNPCSEFLFLDDSACNLASLNVLACRDAAGDVDVAALSAAARTMVLAMEAIVGHASYPTPAVRENALRLRPLGLGLANLGALLTAAGLAYDSDAGRGLAAGVAALVGGAATLASARLAARRGPFAEWRRNRRPALAVLARHRAAAEALPAAAVPARLREAAVLAWREAERLAKRTGLRNAQVTCIAPTGTISFLMDCDTTGVEPELALVKEKRLVGGGRLRLVNRTVAEGLRRLGYAEEAAAAVVAHVEATGSAEGAPGLRDEHLPVFDTAVPTRPGGRALSTEAHLAMMAALQPFVSGAISKTVNLPEDATVDDVERAFLRAWKLGVKAVAVYRDRSKVAQPLVVSAAGGAWGPPEPVGAAGRCPECGVGMIPTGTCLLCSNCGATTGCA